MKLKLMLVHVLCITVSSTQLVLPDSTESSVSVSVVDAPTHSSISVHATQSSRSSSDSHNTTAVKWCHDADDLALWAKHRFRFVDDIKDCGESCLGDPECTAQCMHRKDGYSENCVVCMGQLAECTVNNCLGLCMLGQGPDCKQCTVDNCDHPFAVCSGLPDSEVRHPQAPPGEYKPHHGKTSNALPPTNDATGVVAAEEGGTHASNPGKHSRATTCHVTVWGKQSSEVAPLPECTSDDMKAGTRCCVDGGAPDTPTACLRAGYTAAVAQCETLGKRLCDQREIAGAEGTGCGFDDQRVWTSSQQAPPTPAKSQLLPIEPGPVITAGQEPVGPTPAPMTPPPAPVTQASKPVPPKTPPPPAPVAKSPAAVSAQAAQKATSATSDHQFWNGTAFIVIMVAIGVTLVSGFTLLVWRKFYADAKVTDSVYQYQRVNHDDPF